MNAFDRTKDVQFTYFADYLDIDILHVRRCVEKNYKATLSSYTNKEFEV